MSSWSHLWVDDRGSTWRRTYSKTFNETGAVVQTMTDEELLFDDRRVSDNDLPDSVFQQKYSGPK